MLSGRRMDSVSVRRRLNNYVKSVPHAKWIKRLLCVSILLLVGYGYFYEKSLRIKKDEQIRQLVIVQVNELGEYKNLLNSMTFKQIAADNKMRELNTGLLVQQATIYRLYQELRKYNKSLPPWGGEYKQLTLKINILNNE